MVNHNGVKNSVKKFFNYVKTMMKFFYSNRLTDVYKYYNKLYKIMNYERHTKSLTLYIQYYDSILYKTITSNPDWNLLKKGYYYYKSSRFKGSLNGIYSVKKIIYK